MWYSWLDSEQAYLWKKRSRVCRRRTIRNRRTVVCFLIGFRFRCVHQKWNGFYFHLLIYALWWCVNKKAVQTCWQLWNMHYIAFDFGIKHKWKRESVWSLFVFFFFLTWDWYVMRMQACVVFMFGLMDFNWILCVCMCVSVGSTTYALEHKSENTIRSK